MLVLAIDPGETVGLAVLVYTGPPATEVTVEGYDEWEKLQMPDLVFRFDQILKDFQRKSLHSILVVIEDYKIYAGKANMHVGQHLHTSEVIGALMTICILNEVKYYVIPAAKKARWPEARLRAKFPDHLVTGTHATDALKLGLAYLEQESKYRWTP